MFKGYVPAKLDYFTDFTQILTGVSWTVHSFTYIETHIEENREKREMHFQPDIKFSINWHGYGSAYDSGLIHKYTWTHIRAHRFAIAWIKYTACFISNTGIQSHKCEPYLYTVWFAVNMFVCVCNSIWPCDSSDARVYNSILNMTTLFICYSPSHSHTYIGGQAQRASTSKTSTQKQMRLYTYIIYSVLYYATHYMLARACVRVEFVFVCEQA